MGGQIVSADVAIPSDMTEDELSDDDKPASPELQAIAKGYGVNVPSSSGKKMVFQCIFDRLCQPGREHDLAAWFVYRVYRELVRRATDSPAKGPSDPLIQFIARQFEADPAFIASIRRYRGVDLIRFGRWTAPDGTPHEGGSNRTAAYRSTAQLLRTFAASELRGAVVRVQNNNPVTVIRWLVVTLAVLAMLLGLLGLFVIGPGLVSGGGK